MVNKCCLNGCKTLYSSDPNVKVRLHRFPLRNPKTLPAWIAATGKGKDWKPTKSSRLCNNHFENSDYMVDHKKNILKPIAVPTIEYRVDVLSKKRRKKRNSCKDMKKTNNPLKVEPVDSSDRNVENVQLDYNLKYEHQNKGDHYNHGQSYHKNENEKCTIKNEHFKNFENIHDNGDDSRHENALKKKSEDIEKLLDEFCNRKNQLYLFTSSFNSDISPMTPEESLNTDIDQTIAEESLNTDTDQTIADLNIKNSMTLKLKKQRRIIDKYKKHLKHDDSHSFDTYVRDQIKNLCHNKKLYSIVKHKILKILKKARLKIAKLNLS